MPKLYLIFGATGAYDDWHQWPVKGFTDKDKAEEYLELCQDSADRVCAMVEWQRRLDQKLRPHTKWGIDEYVILHFEYYDLITGEDRSRLDQLKKEGNEEEVEQLWEDTHLQAKESLREAMPYDPSFHMDAFHWRKNPHGVVYTMVESELDPELPVDNEVELDIPAEDYTWQDYDGEDSPE